jgi:hypothetical protein
MPAMRLLRALRLDDSDLSVYDRACEPGEWVVPGSFVFTFSERDPATLTGGQLAAFRHGWLSVESFGWSTLAVVAEITETEQRQVLERLARHFVDDYGAPDLEAALEEARRELAFAADLAGPPPNTILSLQRSLTDDGVAEEFRVHRPREADWQAGQPIRFVPEAG